MNPDFDYESHEWSFVQFVVNPGFIPSSGSP